MTMRPTRSLPATEIELNGEPVLCDASGALYLPADRVVVISDLHLEKGAAYARRGRFLPPYDTAATLDRLDAVLERYQPRLVISLGDSFHDRLGSGHLPQIFRDRLNAQIRGRDWCWISGNHDPEPPEELGGFCSEALALGALVFRHEPTSGKAAGEVAGHLHPGARIVRRGRSVRRACFASDGERLIMPAFGSLTGNLNVLDRAFQGIFTAERLIAYVLGAQIYPINASALKPS